LRRSAVQIFVSKAGVDVFQFLKFGGTLESFEIGPKAFDTEPLTKLLDLSRIGVIPFSNCGNNQLIMPNIILQL